MFALSLCCCLSAAPSHCISTTINHTMCPLGGIATSYGRERKAQSLDDSTPVTTSKDFKWVGVRLWLHDCVHLFVYASVQGLTWTRVCRSAQLCGFTCLWQRAQVNLLFTNTIRESAVAAVTRTIALNSRSYISWYLCMKWSFTIGPPARLMYQLPTILRSCWHLWKLKTARALFTRCTQTHSRIQAFPIHGIYIPVQPVMNEI